MRKQKRPFKNQRDPISGLRRDVVARHIRDIRALDRSYFYRRNPQTGKLERAWLSVAWPHKRDIADYEAELCLKPGTLKRAIEKRIKKKGKIAVLDVGCGLAKFLEDIKKEFGDAVEAHGITLARPLTPEQLKKMLMQDKVPASEAESVIRESEEFHRRVREHSLKIHVGLAEIKKYGKMFDIIVSVQAMRYSLNPERFLLNTLDHLKPGGIAFIQSDSELDKNPRVAEELRRRNILWKKKELVGPLSIEYLYLFKRK